MTNYIASVIRTWTPIGIGAVLTWLASRWGIVIDDQTASGLVAGVVALLAGLWYALARWAEQRFPQIGWLLGLARQPGYGPTAEPPTRDDT